MAESRPESLVPGRTQIRGIAVPRTNPGPRKHLACGGLFFGANESSPVASSDAIPERRQGYRQQQRQLGNAVSGSLIGHAHLTVLGCPRVIDADPLPASPRWRLALTFEVKQHDEDTAAGIGRGVSASPPSTARIALGRGSSSRDGCTLGPRASTSPIRPPGLPIVRRKREFAARLAQLRQADASTQTPKCPRPARES